MIEETKELIKQYPEMSEFEAKLIFIRNKGKVDYKSRVFDTTFLEIPVPIKDASRDQILLHISKLEQARRVIAAYIQGQSQGHSEEVEPELKEKRKNDEIKRDAKRSQPKTLEGIISKSGLSKEQLLAVFAKIIEEKK